MKEKLKLSLTIIVFMGFVSGGIYLMMRDGDKEREYNIQKVQNNYKIGKAVITKISSYKGHSIHVKYIVNDVSHTYEGGFKSNPNGLAVGDSLNIKYAIDSPQYAISELDENYNKF